MSEPPDIGTVVLEVRTNQPDLAADHGWQAGALGVEELPDALRITFADTVAATHARSGLERLGAVTDVTESTRVDWVEQWRPHAQVTRVPPFAVRPPWLAPVDDPTLHELVIDPGPSFGHGAHPTTRLLLGALASHIGPTTRVLDVGCGSGVLAVGAARLGAADVVAIDIDPDAMTATADNAARNGVVVHASQTLLSDLDDRFDVVLANLTAAVLGELAADLRRVTDGHLLVSGVRTGQQVNELTELRWIDEEDGWVAGVLRCEP